MLKVALAYLNFYRDTRGLTIVEYAIAGGIIAVAVVVAFITLGGNVSTQIECLGDAVTGVDCNAAGG